MTHATHCRGRAAPGPAPRTARPALGIGWLWGDLVALDRTVLRALGDMFIRAGRHVVGYGLAETDQHLLAAARAILRGGRRPAGQDGIALYGGPVTDDDHYARRLWPRRHIDTGGSFEDTPPF